MHLFIKHSIYVTALSFLTSIAGAACPEWISKQKELPLCPDGQALSETYPVGALIVSDRGVLTRDSDYAAQVVTKTFAAQPDKSPLVVLPVTDETMVRIKERIDAMKATPEQKQRWKSQLVQVKGRSYPWQQDYFESFVNPKTGVSEVRKLENYQEDMGETFDAIAKALNSCGIATGQPLKSKSEVGGRYGGNIEALPEGICLLGNDAFPTKQEWSDYADQFCGTNKDMRIEVPTYFLGIGHSDEVVKVVPNNNPAPCNFSVSVASPKKALEILKENGKGALLSNPKNTIMNFRIGRRRGMIGTSALTILCRAVKGAQATPDVDEQGGVSFIEWLTKPNEAFADEEECAKITNAAAYNAVVKDKEFKAYNDTIQKEMDQLKQDIQSKISKKIPQCKVDFIDVPNLFFGGSVVDGGERKLTEGMGESLLPNPTNSLSAGKTIVNPDPQNAAFKKYIEQEYKKRGITSDFIDTYGYAHISGGNLHCSTHTIHMCQGRGK